MTEIVRVGAQPIRLYATLLVGSVPTNATVLRLEVTTPSAVMTEYVFGDDAELVNPSAGQYYFDLQVNAPGIWSYAWYAEGSNAAFKTGTIDVARPLTILTVDQSTPAAAVPFVSIKVWDADGNEVDIEGVRTDTVGVHVTSLPPGSYRVLASKIGWIYETAKIVDLTGDGPYTIQLEGRALSSRWLQWEDLETIADASVIDRLFNDTNTATRDMKLIEGVIEQAEALAESKMLRNWSRDQVAAMARSDKAIRSQAAWLALEFASERKQEFISMDGKGRYWAQYERSMAFFDSISRSEDRPRGEETGGQGANVGGEVRPLLQHQQDPFVFALGRNGRGPGGF